MQSKGATTTVLAMTSLPVIVTIMLVLMLLVVSLWLSTTRMNQIQGSARSAVPAASRSEKTLESVSLAEEYQVGSTTADALDRSFSQ